MQTQRINITIPADLLRDLRRTIPDGKRSQFIADVLKEKISRRKNLKRDWVKSLRENREFYKKIHEEFKYVDAEAFEKLP